MCVDCSKALEETFPEVPANEAGNFLMNCTAFPFGDAALIKKQLTELRARTSNYKECYALVEADMDVQMAELVDALVSEASE